VAAWLTFRYAEDWAIEPTQENLKRLRQSMYKIVTWSETQRPELGEYSDGAPARTAYVAGV